MFRGDTFLKRIYAQTPLFFGLLSNEPYIAEGCGQGGGAVVVIHL